jgi:hypothetical protein
VFCSDLNLPGGLIPTDDYCNSIPNNSKEFCLDTQNAPEACPRQYTGALIPVVHRRKYLPAFRVWRTRSSLFHPTGFRICRLPVILHGHAEIFAVSLGMADAIKPFAPDRLPNLPLSGHPAWTRGNICRLSGYDGRDHAFCTRPASEFAAFRSSCMDTRKYLPAFRV